MNKATELRMRRTSRQEGGARHGEGDELQSTHVPSPSAWTTTLVEYGEPIGGMGAKFGCGLHGDRCCFGASRQHRQLVIEACQIQLDHNAEIGRSSCRDRVCQYV